MARHNPRRVKARRAYSFSELAQLYKVHIRTVQKWRKQGLEVIPDQSQPFLVMGFEVQRFLKDQSAKRKHPLRADQLFCSRCRLPQKPALESLAIQSTARQLGRQYKQVIIKGKCEVCNQSMIRFSSDKQLPELIAKGLLLSQPPKGLTGDANSSVNTDMMKERVL